MGLQSILQHKQLPDYLKYGAGFCYYFEIDNQINNDYYSYERLYYPGWRTIKQACKSVQPAPVKEQFDYIYYRQQDKLSDGSFCLRFPQIINSPINDKWYKQLLFAVQFQWKKMWLKFPIQGILKKQQNINLQANDNQIRMTWLGHASVCLSIKGKVNILFDPLLQNRIVQYVGEKRLIEPACRIQELPNIDLVLVSHDHYDHCNVKSLKMIRNRFKDVQYLFGKNSQDILPKGYLYKELSWTHFKQFNINDQKVKITFVPACHWSKRSLNDQNHRLWGGFVVEACGKKIYFAGDTGMCGLFKQLQYFFKDFDLSLLPIGAYQPNEKLHAQHTNPKQAVQIHNIIKSKCSVGIHWGTFPMSHETPEQVLRDLKQALQHKTTGQFIAVNIGGGVSIPLQKQINSTKTYKPDYIKFGDILL